MNRWPRLIVWLWAIVCSAGLVLGDEKPTSPPGLLRVAFGDLQIGLEPAHGSLRELAYVPDGDNRLADREEPFSLWEITVVVDEKAVGEKTITLAPAQLGAPKIETISEAKPGLRMIWEQVPLFEKQPLRVVAEVRLDEQGSHWGLTVQKPQDVRLKEIRFPRVPALKPREREVVAIPVLMGRLLSDPRKLLQDPNNKNPRLAWVYPHPLTMQCLAYYEPDGPGFYAACDDTQSYIKTFLLWSDAQQQVHFEVDHTPEEEAFGASEFRLPYAVVLRAFRGDWMTAAEHYRQSPTALAIAAKGRLRRDLVPEWVQKTGLWVWNRGRSEDVLVPAAELQEHVQTPVSVLWHWWHDCAYDAGFPEYLPPREGALPFHAALQAAQQKGLHAILYMNQRIWGMDTASWKQEDAKRYSVKGADGNVHPEVYNVFMKAPCAPMCIGTDFWRKKYAGLAQEVLCSLEADGIYMDQTGVRGACYDPNHGHVVGPGRYWFEGIGPLAAMIRQRSSARGLVALGGEYCVEPVLPDMDVVLSLDVGADRNGLGRPWEVIPFFQAVYHPSTITFGNMAGLVYPPYDERWPPEKAPPERLTLLDRKFSQEFCLEQARTFVWGMQPMIANFRPELFRERPEEIDYLTRLVRTRQQALKYLLHGTWLRPPALDVPQRAIDVATVGIYTRLTASRRQYPVALAGAWRAPDGHVAIALASIHDAPLPLQLPIDFQAYGLGQRCTVCRIDASGQHGLEPLERANPVLKLELPPRGICVLELGLSE